MKLSSAEILRQGQREIRAIGGKCDPACAMWSCCKNSTPDGICRGFFLLNGKSQNLLNKTLNETDKIYVRNCIQTLQRGTCGAETQEGIVREVLRYIPPQEPEQTDFAGAMLRGFSNIHGSIAPMVTPNPEDAFPEMCESDCKHVQCPYRRQENFGKPCLQRLKPLNRSLNPNEA